MKKSIMLFLFFVIIFGTILRVSAEDTMSYQYKIYPESDKWDNFNSLELKDMLDISTEETEKMDTKTLLNFVLSYPFLGDIYAFDDPLKGIDFIADQFNGLQVLLKREYLKDILIKNYVDSVNKIEESEETINFEETYKHKYRESLIAYLNESNKLSSSEKNAIILSSNINTKLINKNLITNVMSQSTIGISGAGDIIRYGTVYTPSPKLSKISVFELVDMSSTDKTSFNSYMDSRYPKATRLRSATYKYNCHSYAWYSTSTSNVWWMNDPTKYMTDGSYLKSSSPKANYKIYYPASGNQHSGIISSVSGSTVTVTSKWGAYGLYKHTANNCPYVSPVYSNSYWTKAYP